LYSRVNSSQESALQAISKAEQEFMTKAKEDTLNSADFQKLFKRYEKSLPTEVRVLNRLYELQEQAKAAIDTSLNENRTLNDWKKFERITRKGLRIAMKFNNSEFRDLFHPIHAVTERHIRLSEQSNR
jgi:DNA-binding cell septation regulator SpoVG